MEMALESGRGGLAQAGPRRGAERAALALPDRSRHAARHVGGGEDARRHGLQGVRHLAARGELSRRPVRRQDRANSPRSCRPTISARSAPERPAASPPNTWPDPTPPPSACSAPANRHAPNCSPSARCARSSTSTCFPVTMIIAEHSARRWRRSVNAPSSRRPPGRRRPRQGHRHHRDSIAASRCCSATGSAREPI